jgi:hypothetical protein
VVYPDINNYICRENEEIKNLWMETLIHDVTCIEGFFEVEKGVEHVVDIYIYY